MKYYYDNQTLDSNQLSQYLIVTHLQSQGKTKQQILEILQFPLDTIAVELGENDIQFFCLYFLRDTFIPSDNNIARNLSPYHYEIWNILNDTFINHKYNKLNILAPRGFAKSTVINKALSIFLICYKKSKVTIVCAKTDIDAQNFMSSIKVEIKENKLILENFGKLIDNQNRTVKVNATETEFTNGCYIRAISSGTSFRGINHKGVRPSVILTDDMASEADIITEDSRNKLYNKYTKEVLECGDKPVIRSGKVINYGTTFINIGTVLHNDCLCSRLSRNKSFFTYKLTAILIDKTKYSTVDELFSSTYWEECRKIYYKDSIDKARAYYEKHKSMRFPVVWEKYDCFELFVSYLENRIAFQSEMMNDATNIGEKLFKSVATITARELEHIDYKVEIMTIDPASSVKATADRTAILCGGLSNNQIYVYDYILDRLSFDSYCTKVVDLLELHPNIKTVYIEKNVYKDADLEKIKAIMKERNITRKINFETYHQNSNKDDRISTIINDINFGRVMLNEDNRYFEEARNEILEFCGQKYSVHDDMPDALATLVNKLNQTKQNTKVVLLDRQLLGL